MSYIPYIDPDHYGNFFQIDDVSTPIDPAAEHFVISGYGTYGAPERDVEAVAVPGRNGDLIFDNGRFTNAEVYYDIGWARGFGGDFSYDIGNTDLQDWDRGSAFPGDIGITCTIDRTTGTVSVSGTLTSGSSTVFEMYISLTRGRYKFVPNASGTMSAYYYGVLLDENLYDTTTTVMEFPLSSGFTEKFIDIPQDGEYRFWLQLKGQGNVYNDTLQPRIYSVGVTQNPYTGFDYFRGQLMSKSDTYYKLTDSYHPGEYRMARVARIEDLQLGALNDSGRCRIVFDCKPQRYLVSGDEEQNINAGTETSVVLNSFYPSYPMFVIRPNAADPPITAARIDTVTITNVATINGIVKTMTAVISAAARGAQYFYPGVLYVDCSARAAVYADDGELQEGASTEIIQQATSDFPYLVPPNMGTNAVTITLTGTSLNHVECAVMTKEYVI